MKKSFLISLILLSLVLVNNLFAQINTGGTASVPFGSNTNYQYGIMPTNLPTGTYGGSTKAGEAYTTWRSTYATACGGGFRVPFGPDETSNTVSEGIAYGMLLSVYAADKAMFDGLWATYKANLDGNGIMNWKISGCSGTVSSGGATDAEMDVAMALIIAAEQWSASSATYLAAAVSMIQKIKNFEMAGDGQTLNGDTWGNTNTCRNPSYFAPAYYKEFAKVDTDNATFWNTTAINASNTILTANRNSTSGLVSNWCDNSGTENTCGNTGSGATGYGADACRNPWRMAVDYLWHGSSASTAAQNINTKLIAFVNGYENQLKGPFPNRSVSNPSTGSYINGSYTTFALPTMTSTAAQTSLNKCYTAVANLSNTDQYFNSTIRCISMFVLTGNFWAPGASGFVFPPTITSGATNATGTTITLTANKTLTTSTPTASTFTIYLNGVAQSGGVTAASVSGTTITLTIATAAKPQPGQTITVSYSGTSITSTEGSPLATFTGQSVLNLLEGNETILDDCEDGNELNNVGGIWFTFNDTKDQNAACTPGTKSIMNPLSSVTNPFRMTAPGYNGAATAYCVKANYTLGTNYTPFNGGSCATWTNPSYVGIGTWVDDVETNTMDWRNGTGVSFWYKGPSVDFQVIISEVTDYCFHKYTVPATTDWTKITILWSQLAQPTWGVQKTFTAQHVQKLQWQYSTGTSGAANSTGIIYIDDVRIMNMPPVALTALTIGVKATSDIQDPLNLTLTSTDTLKLEVIPTPTTASYPVVFWSSSDTTVVKVDYLGQIKVIGYGEAVITARSKMHQTISATYTVKVPPPTVNPTSITFTPNTYSVAVGSTALLIPTFAPTGVTETGLTWTTSNAAIATVNSSGTVTGVAVGGPVTITATSTAVGTVKGTASVTVIKVDVTGVTVDQSTVSLVLGESATVVATVAPTNATNKNVTWSTSNASIATVTNGVISSVGVGTCTITVTSVDNTSILATVAVTVTGVAVTSVSVTPTTATILVGGTTSLTPTVLPAGAVQTVTYTSGTPGVATVNASGLVTGVSVGTSVVTVASTDDPTKTATCTITVDPVLVTSITVAPTTATLYVGDNTTLSATVAPTNATVATYTWSSSNTSVATVDGTGTVTAVAIGTATITATANDASGKTGTCAVTVSPRLVTGITMTPTTATMYVNDNTTLTATVAPANATINTVSWSSSNTSVATVNSSGVVTALAIGTATITAIANDASGITATCAVTVSARLVTSITVLPTTVSIVVESTSTITPTVLPANASNSNINWTSSNTAIATVNASGVITAVAVGSATITATAADGSGITATVSVTVTPLLVSSIVMTPTTAAIYVGDNTTVTATVTPSNATNTNVIWSSSSASIATVDAFGVVTAIAEGTAIITVTAADGSGKTATCIVTVSNRLVTDITMTPTTATTLYVGDNTTLIAVVAPANATNGSVTWTSSNTTVATVNSSGIVNALALGNATITATANDASGKTATCAVTVAPRLVGSITLSSNTASIVVGNTSNITATVLPANATNTNVIWTSSNTSIATVNASGVITAVAVGSATITATAADGSGITATVAVTVTPLLVSSITIAPNTATMFIGDNTTLVATVLPANATNTSVVWTTSNASVATVVNGVVSAISEGTATVTATAADGSGILGTCAITVNPVLPISVSTSTAIGFVTGDPSQTLTATVLPANTTNQNVTWSSSNTAVATVNPTTGEVTPIGVGTCIITVSCNAATSVTAACNVTVDASVTHVISVTLDNTTVIIPNGATGTLVATVLPANATDKSVVWSSSNTTVATVSNGIISALSIGTATITVTTVDGGLTATCVVTVSAIPVTGVTLDQTTLSLTMASAAVQLAATVAPANATDKTVTWTSSNTAAAIVSTTGLVTPTGIGTANITVTTTDGSYTAVCAVTVSAIPVTGVSLDQTTLSLTMASTAVQLTATVLPANATDKTVTWTSSNTAAATVSATGLITVVGLGSTTITVTTTDGGLTATCAVTVSAIPVTGITLNPTTLPLTMSSAPTAIVATVLPANASNPAITWTTGNAAIATVSASGVVTPTGIGTAIITATAADGSGISTTCAVTVSAIPVTGITLDQTTLSLAATSAPVQLTATIAPSDATNKLVSWVSSNTAVATVSATGLVTVVGLGNTNIVVTTIDGSFTATCVVTVSSIPVTAITLDQTTLALTMSSSPVTITPTIAPVTASDKSVIWTTSNAAAATVNALGVVTPTGIGSAIITATANDGSGITATCNVTVSTVAVTGVTLDQTTLTLAASSTPVQLTATVAPTNASNKNVTWTTSNASVASVSATGVVSVIGIGTANITVTTTDGGFTAICAVTVSAIPVTGITLDQSTLTMTVSTAPITITPTIAPIDASVKTVTWTSSNTGIATVNASGIVTAIAVGTATITCTATDGSGVFATCLVTVNAIPVTSVSVTPSIVSLTLLQTITLSAIVLPADATNQNVTWSSSNPSVATVDNSGFVVANSAGSTILTVTTVDGAKTATVNVSVVVATIPVTGVSVTPSITTIQLNETAQLTATISPSNATNKNVTWTSNNTAIATVDATGLVTPLAPGSVIITATTEDGSFTATSSITVTNILTTSINIDNTLALAIGASGSLSATVVPSGASTNVTWSSNNTAVATVNASGLVSSVGVGTAIITATANDGTGIESNQCLVTVSAISVTGVTVSPTSVIIAIGGATTTLTASVIPANATNQNVSWLVNSPQFVTVNNGVLTAVAIGSAIVTVTTQDNGFSAQCNVEVVDKAELVSEITRIQAVHNAAVVGTAIGQYPASAKTILQTAINTAQAVVTSTTSTQVQIDAAVATLLVAEIDFYRTQVVNETLIFNAELDNLTYLNTYWYSYNDSEPGGSSIVTPLTDATNIFTMSQTGANGTANAAMIDYSLMGEAALGYNPFVGMGLQMNDPIAPYDLTGSTGISFMVKSNNSYFLEINLSTISDDCNYYVELPASTNWTEVRLSWVDFAQYTWGTQRTWDLSKINNFQWKIQSIDGTTGQLWVDEVKILGIILDLPVLDIVDKTVLETTITDAQAMYSAAVVGTAEGQYPQSAKTNLQLAISTANVVFNNADATQEEVDQAVLDLQAAVTTFQAQEVHVNKALLVSAVTNAQTIHDAAVEGVANGQYPVGSKTTLQNAINTANAVATNSLATQVQVDAAIATLNSAVTTFQNSIISIDKTALAALIATSQTTHNDATEGTADGEYPTGSKADLQTAINTASAVNSNTAASQAQVNTAQTNLQTALDIFIASVNTSGPVDKTVLQTKITNAQSAYNSAVEGVLNGQYPSGSKNILLAATTTAQGVYNNTSATQAQVNIAAINLQTAITEFLAKQIVVDKSGLVSTIATAQTLYDGATEGTLNNQYPVGSKANLLAAITTASGVNTTSAVSQAQVTQAIADLEAAMATFQALQIHITLNTTTLVNTIAEANTVLDDASGNVGTNPGNYPPTATNTFINEIAIAESVLSNATTQTEINTAVTNLQMAIYVYQNSIIPTPVDKSNLQSLIAISEDLFETTVIGENPGEYGNVEFYNLYNVYGASQSVNADQNATQTEVDNQSALLQAAITTYINSMVPIIPESIDDVVKVTISAWPNPCVNTVTISSSKSIAKIEIVNLLGATKIVKNVNDSKTSINVSDLAQGVYLFKVIHTNGSVETVKITKQ